MEREVRGITLFSVLWEIMIFGGFISANELAIKNLVQAYEWLFLLFLQRFRCWRFYVVLLLYTNIQEPSFIGKW